MIISLIFHTSVETLHGWPLPSTISDMNRNVFSKIQSNKCTSQNLKDGLFRCHIDAAEQQRALNFELVVSDKLFSVNLAAYNQFKIQRPLLLSGINMTSE